MCRWIICAHDIYPISRGEFSLPRGDGPKRIKTCRNPLRYRGYVYDTETELYYLQSRYYDPELGRFINADALVSTGQGVLGNNMFAYCRNNPVRRKDVSGTTAVEIFDDDASLVDGDKEIDGTKIGGGGGAGGNGSKTNPYTGGSYSSGQYYPNTPGSNPQYTPPNGGGGVTSSTTVGSVQVDFDHGGRHIDTSKINYYDLQEVIAHDVINQPQYLNSTKNVLITYDGYPIQYSYHCFSPSHINIGTYYAENTLK